MLELLYLLGASMAISQSQQRDEIKVLREKVEKYEKEEKRVKENHENE